MIKRKPNPNKTLQEEVAATSREVKALDLSSGEVSTLSPVNASSEYTTEENTNNLRFIVGAELGRFKHKVKSGITLNDKETRQVGNLAETQRTVIEIETQQAKLSKYDKMTTEQLIDALFDAAMHFPEDKYIELIGRCLENRPIKS